MDKVSQIYAEHPQIVQDGCRGDGVGDSQDRGEARDGIVEGANARSIASHAILISDVVCFYTRSSEDFRAGRMLVVVDDEDRGETKAI